MRPRTREPLEHNCSGLPDEEIEGTVEVGAFIKQARWPGDLAGGATQPVPDVVTVRLEHIPTGVQVERTGQTDPATADAFQALGDAVRKHQTT